MVIKRVVCLHLDDSRINLLEDLDILVWLLILLKKIDENDLVWKIILLVQINIIRNTLDGNELQGLTLITLNIAV